MRKPEIIDEGNQTQEAFPGVPHWRMNIAPVDNAPFLTSEAELFLLNLTNTANQYFDDLALDMKAGDRNDYFSIHTEHQKAEELVLNTATTVYNVTSENPSVHLVLFPAGAIPLGQHLIKMGYPSHRMHAVDISGSKGTETGSARIKNGVPLALLDPSNTIVIPEDIIDSLDTIFQVVQARSTKRDSSINNIQWLQKLEQRLKEAHQNGNNDFEAYADFTMAAAKEQVSLLAVWSKNEQTRQLLHKTATGIQEELLSGHPIVQLPEKLWVLGGKRLMDTGILWHSIVEELPPFLREDPRVTGYMKYNNKNGKKTLDGEWLVRAVRINPLAYFEDKSNQADNVIKSFADLATQMLKSQS